MLLRPVAMLQRKIPAVLGTLHAYVQFDKRSLHACTSLPQQQLNVAVHERACGILLLAVKVH